jgi:hypothetical protein
MKIFVARILVALVREIEELGMEMANKATGIILERLPTEPFFAVSTNNNCS